MNIGPITHRCGVCGEQWWDAHCCPKQTPPMTMAGFFDEAKRLNLRMLGTPVETRAALDLKDAEIARLTAALKQANDQAEHFERLWYLTNEDAGRYAFAKTLEGQVVTMETFKVRGAAELDQALDDAMAEEAATHGGEPQSAVAAAYGGLVQTPQG